MDTKTLAEPPQVGAVATIINKDESGQPIPVTVAAQATAAPGLVITPAFSNGKFTGSFTLTHSASGYAVITFADDIHVIQRIADQFATLPVDWTADRETVTKAVLANQDAYRGAGRAGLYPKPQEDPDGTPQSSEIAPYPRSESEATANALAKHLTRALQYRCRDTWELVRRDDKDGRRIYLTNAAALIAEWGLVVALRGIAKTDPEAADGIARQIWAGWEAGDTTHDDTWAWAREYGIPELPDEDEK